MAKKSEFSSYVFIKNDLSKLRWNTKNPNRNALGQLYTQQECLDHPELALGLRKQRPEYVVKVSEEAYWVIEAKATHEQIEDAFLEAVAYASDINKSSVVRACLATGVAGNDDDGYLVTTAFIDLHGKREYVKYNGKK